MPIPAATREAPTPLRRIWEALVVVLTYAAATAAAAVALPAILAPVPVRAVAPEPPPVVARTPMAVEAAP